MDELQCDCGGIPAVIYIETPYCNRCWVEFCDDEDRIAKSKFPDREFKMRKRRKKKKKA